MSKAGKGGGKAKKGGDNDHADLRERKLQAIVLADSFTKSFRPITWQTPKVLLPLVNVPMLEYTIEFLAQNGVEEIWLFCVWHAKEVEEYISKSKWSSTIAVKCIHSSRCSSPGDALREIDQMGVINSDPFILISGDVISNMDLKRAIEFHKKRKKEDNDCIMTVVMKKIRANAGVKPIIDDLVVAMDKKTNQLLYYEDNYKNPTINFPYEIIKSHKYLELCSNVLDCHIDICSPEFLVQFGDNLDYHDIRGQFIQNEVVNWELGMHMYGYVLTDEYAARVHDPRTYHYICRDIVNRWVYPLVPDSLLLPDSSYIHVGKYVYKENGVKIARSARVGIGVVIGRNTVIEDNVQIEKTVIGRDCVIKSGATIKDSHLWSNTIVQSNASIVSSIICDNCQIMDNANITRGCVLSYGVIIGKDVTLPEFARISRQSWNSETRKAVEMNTNFDTDVIGDDGKGYVWTALEGTGDYDDEESGDEEDTQDSEQKKLLDPVKLACIGYTEGVAWKAALRSNVDFDTDDGASSEAEEEFDFEQVVGDTIMTGHQRGDPIENVIMEVKSVKFAHNREFSDCVNGIIPALLEIISQKSSEIVKGSDMVKIMTCAKQLFAKDSGWGYRLLKPLLQEDHDRFTLIESLEDEALVDESPYYNLFRMMLQVFHESELVTEEVFEQWIEERQEEEDKEDGVGKLFNEPFVQEFVEWLQDDESESGSDDDEADD